MTKPLIFVVILFAFVAPVCLAKNDPLDLVQLARDDKQAILQITYWGEEGSSPGAFNVDGTGFLVGREGYFITAAHVLERYKANTAQLTAVIHQRDNSGGGRWFEIVELDKDHDLALCKISGFHAFKEPVQTKIPNSAFSPAASVTIASQPVEQGEPIAIFGFPLGSVATPIIQMGNIGATNALLSNVASFPAGRHDLLIVSVSGNHGDSGGPVISLRSGEVVGMVIQYVPAPLMTVNTPEGPRTVPQQSGLMVAVPSKWISDIMTRHGVSNAPLKVSEHLVM